MSILQSLEALILLFVASRIGRLTGRLPKELADDVVESLLDFFRCVCVALMVDRIIANTHCLVV